MTVYSYAQLEQLWINAGGSPGMAPVMAAIAEAESSGNSNAVSPTQDYGLWQINRSAWGPQAATLDPAGNAASAVHVYQTQGLTAWTTYNSGAYRQFLSGSTTPNPNVPGSSGAAGVTQATLTAAAASASTCLVGFTTPSVLGIGGGTVCIVSKANMRNVVGSFMLVAGGFLVLAGVILVVGVGLGQSRVTRQAAGMVPGMGKFVSAVA